MERYAEEENVLKENFDADKGYEDTRFQNEMDALNARHEAKLISEQDYYLELERLEREHQEKMERIAQIMAGKAICIWPSAYHVNLPYLQGKKLKTALNLFIGDHIKM